MKNAYLNPISVSIEFQNTRSGFTINSMKFTMKIGVFGQFGFFSSIANLNDNFFVWATSPVTSIRRTHFGTLSKITFDFFMQITGWGGGNVFTSSMGFRLSVIAAGKGKTKMFLTFTTVKNITYRYYTIISPIHLRVYRHRYLTVSCLAFRSKYYFYFFFSTTSTVISGFFFFFFVFCYDNYSL